MKYLVDTQTGNVCGTYSDRQITSFSISGKYVIDIPDSLAVKVNTNSVTDLINAKVAAFKLAQSMSGALNDELLATPNVDLVKSFRFAAGPNKRTVMLRNGGQVVTNAVTLAGGSSNVFMHWHGFLLGSNPGTLSATPQPPSLGYGLDSDTLIFPGFSPAVFTLDVRNSINTVTLATLSWDTKTALVIAPGVSVRFRFTNTDPNKDYHLSDWIFLYQ